jgi:NAD+ synthase
MFNVKEETSVIKDGISRYFKDHGMTTAIVGISGGKDSSVVASLCCNVLGAHNVAGVMMPNGEQKDMADSLELVKFLNMKQTYTVNIGKMYSAMSDAVPMEMTDAFRTNAPARLRMCVLYGIANKIPHALVMNTCNYSEDCLGYSTFYGDSAGDYAPIRMYTVTEVRAIGAYLGLPAHLVAKTPNDGMCGMSDEEKISKELGFPFTYERFDELVRGYGDTFTDDEKQKITSKIAANRYKTDIIQIPTEMSMI